MNIIPRRKRDGAEVIDIHCHILPGLDDGPQRLETSLAMASVALRDNIRVIIATPHTDGVSVNRDTVTAKVIELNSELEQLAMGIEIVAGYEIPYHLVAELAPTHTLAGSRYVLIEYPHTYIPGDARTTIQRLVQQGLQPIIAHPERNGGVLEQPDRLAESIQAGALTQLTAASLTGELGPDLQRCAMYLLSNGLVHFIGTDSHSPSFRTPVLKKAHTMAAKLVGREQADQLTMVNPGRILRAGTARNTM